MSVAEQLPFPETARSTDPETSHAAAARVQRTRGELEQLIVDTVGSSRFPMTQEQIADRIVLLHPKRWRWGTVVTAVSRAVRAGGIELSPAVGTTSAGSPARTYIVAGGHA